MPAGTTVINGLLDMNGNAISKLKVQPVTAFPGSPFDGQIVYRTDLKRYFYYDSGAPAWKDLSQQLADLAAMLGAELTIADEVTEFAENENAALRVKRYDNTESRQDAKLSWDEATKTWSIGYGTLLYKVPRKHIHTQAAPLASWVITHNLNTQDVHVSILDATNEIVYATVVATSVNVVTITFASPQTGRAVVIG